METPRYLQILWSYKWLVLIGLVVAIAAGLLAGFTISDGKIVSRAEGTYTAANTVMLQGEGSELLQSEIPGTTISATAPPTTTTTAPQSQDLANSALLYAYLASSDAMKSRVESVVGKFSLTDGLTAVSRTTQPAGDEAFPGRLELPIIDIEGTASTPQRAVAIADAGAVQFRKYIVAEQDKALVPTAIRVDLVTLQKKPAVEGDGSNPAIPIAVAAGGVFLAFIALIFIIHGARTSRKKTKKSAQKARRRAEPSDSGAAASKDVTFESLLGTDDPAEPSAPNRT
jgi:hypothetical protein